MRKIITLLIIALAFLSTQAQTIIKSFSEQDMRMAVITCVKPTSDGGFAFGGFTSDTFPTYHSAGFLLKLDSLFNVIWAKKYDSGEPYDQIFDIDVTTDNGFLLIGYYTANLFDPYGFSIIKTDANGNSLLERTYPGYSIYTYCKTSDNGFLLGGITSGLNGSLLGLTKIDSAFNLQWSYAYTSSDTTTAYAESVKETPDHGFIVTGATRSVNGNPYDAIYLLKTDSLGTPLWSRTYNIPHVNSGNDLILDSDSGFTIGGIGSRIIDTLGNSTQLEMLMKTDKTGNVLWGNLYNVLGGNIDHVEKIADNGYYIYDGLIVSKTDSVGNIGWTKSLFIDAYNLYYAYYQSDTNYSLLLGGIGGIQKESAFLLRTNNQKDSCTVWLNNIATYPYNPTVDSITFTLAPQYGQDTVVSVSSDLIFTDSVLCTNGVYTSVQNIDKTVNANAGIKLYPNPAGNQLIIDDSRFTIKSIEIYNVLGVCCLKSESENPKSEMTMDVSNLSSGVYFVRVSDETQSFVSKFVKE